MDAYIEKHLAQSGYRALGDGRYLHPEGWTDVRIGAHTVFAHRDTEYTAETCSTFRAIALPRRARGA